MTSVVDTFTVCGKRLSVHANCMKMRCDKRGLLVTSSRLEMKIQDLKPKAIIELELNFQSPKFSHLIKGFSNMWFKTIY